jgi:O-acetyl-ADP-ribose deacetylase (regulator of RNase III)
MLRITYKTGDVLRHQPERLCVVAHVCNNLGTWGRGFVTALSARWPAPEGRYRQWHAKGGDFKLGAVQFIKVEPLIVVANMVAQSGYSRPGRPAIEYWALDECLDRVGDFAHLANAEVIGPRFGCGLAGGDWEKVEPLIVKNVVGRGVPVTIYDLP